MSKITVSLSPTSIGTWEESQLIFYYNYIVKQERDTVVPQVYGISGGLVHEAIEMFTNGDHSYKKWFDEQWDKNNLTDTPGLFGSYLKKDQYDLALERGVAIVNDKKSLPESKHITEEKHKFLLAETEWMDFYLSGIVDYQVVDKDGSIEIIDWKTSSKVDASGQFKRQALHYCFSLYKAKGVLPSRVTFHYIKINKTKTYEFTQKDLDEYIEYVKGVVQDIANKELDVKNYEIGDISSIFNEYKLACEKERLSR